MGMRPIVIDSGEAKKKLATTLGAEVFLDFKEETDIASRIKEIADGLGANGVIVTAWQTYKGTLRNTPPITHLPPSPAPYTSLTPSHRRSILHRRSSQRQNRMYRSPTSRSKHHRGSAAIVVRAEKINRHWMSRGDSTRYSFCTQLCQTGIVETYC